MSTASRPCGDACGFERVERLRTRAERRSRQRPSGARPASATDDLPLPDAPTIATNPFARSNSEQRPRPLLARRTDRRPRATNGARPGYGLRAGSGGAVTPSATTAERSSLPSIPRSWFGPSARRSTPAGGATPTTDAVDADEQDLPGPARSRIRAARFTVGPQDVVVDGDELAGAIPIRMCTPSGAGREGALQCNGRADCVDRVGERRDRGVALDRCAEAADRRDPRRCGRS